MGKGDVGKRYHSPRAIYIYNLKFTDDINLLDKVIPCLQHMLNTLRRCGKHRNVHKRGQNEVSDLQ